MILISITRRVDLAKSVYKSHLDIGYFKGTFTKSMWTLTKKINLFIICLPLGINMLIIQSIPRPQEEKDKERLVIEKILSANEKSKQL